MTDRPIRYIDEATFKAVMEQVIAEDDEALRRLAEIERAERIESNAVIRRLAEKNASLLSALAEHDQDAMTCPHCERLGDLVPTDEALADIERILREGTPVSLSDLSQAEMERLIMGEDLPDEPGFAEFDAVILLTDHVEEWTDPESQTTRIEGFAKGTRGTIIDLKPGARHCVFEAEGSEHPVVVLLENLRKV